MRFRKNKGRMCTKRSFSGKERPELSQEWQREHMGEAEGPGHCKELVRILSVLLNAHGCSSQLQVCIKNVAAGSGIHHHVFQVT